MIAMRGVSRRPCASVSSISLCFVNIASFIAPSSASRSRPAAEATARRKLSPEFRAIGYTIGKDVR
jgi:hypothetical protein